MDKLKRFTDIQIPVTTCTLRCHYCYITQTGLFKAALPKMKYSAAQIGLALSKERLGGICHFNMCGDGETLLPPEMTDIVKAILEQGHYIMIVTNGTVTVRFKEMMEQYPPDLKKRLGFKFSFHYLELKKKNLLDKFFSNVQLVKDSGCSFSLELTPSDELIPYISDVKKECIERVGALCHVTVARDETDDDFILLTKHSKEDYKKIWETFDSDLFDFKISVFGEKRNEFCYAGVWGGILDLGTGILRACDKTFLRQNILDDPQKPIDWKPIGVCNKAHCHNAHVWLTLGMIPSLDTPTYSQMRNRELADGTSWLTPEMNAFLGQKLSDENVRFSEKEEQKIRSCELRRNFLWNISYKSKQAVKKILHVLHIKK